MIDEVIHNERHVPKWAKASTGGNDGERRDCARAAQRADDELQAGRGAMHGGVDDVHAADSEVRCGKLGADDVRNEAGLEARCMHFAAEQAGQDVEATPGGQRRATPASDERQRLADLRRYLRDGGKVVALVDVEDECLEQVGALLDTTLCAMHGEGSVREATDGRVDDHYRSGGRVERSKASSGSDAKGDDSRHAGQAGQGEGGRSITDSEHSITDSEHSASYS